MTRSRLIRSGLGLLLCLPLGAGARELAVADRDLVPAELVAVAPVAGTGLAALVLQPASGDLLPMFTGEPEAAAIARALQHQRPERPLTHELLGDLLEASGARVERLVIDELRDEQFLAALEIRDADGSRRLVDTRPSDGLALAVRVGAPVFVARQVLAAAAAEPQAPPPPPLRA